MLKLFFTVIFCFVAVTHCGPIVGGNDAPDGKYPYMVSIRYVNSHFCGGSILDKRWILTAAHCLKGFEDIPLEVVAGTNLLEGGNNQTYIAEHIVIHKKHNIPKMRRNDIGMIRVDRDIEFNDKVQPIALSKFDCLRNGDPLKMTGWGCTELRGPSPNKLQEIDLRVFDHKKCKDEMQLIADVVKTQICTLTKAGEGCCHRDSGGPLVLNGVQVGIASFINPYTQGKPDVFTRVSSYSKWIEYKKAKFQKN